MSEKKDTNSKNYLVYGALGLIVLLTIVIASVIVVHQSRFADQPDTPIPEGPEPLIETEFIYLDQPTTELSADLPQNGTIITDQAEIDKYFDMDDDLDFTKHHYLFFSTTYNSCGEYDVNPIDYLVRVEEPIHYTINIEYSTNCGNCADITDYYLLPVDLTVTSATISLNYKLVDSDPCDDDDRFVVKKPIIYLYPTRTTDVTVKLTHPELITSSYPKYTNGWKVTAEPSGKLIDKTTGRELYSLYWEGTGRNAKMHTDGFIVKGTDVADFLEDKLATLGLTEREAEEFIIYWLPVLEQNNYNYIRFETQAEINAYMPLEINPKPDTLIRVIMDYKPLDAPINVAEQKLATPTRTGFTVVEWGGTQIK